MKRVWWQHQAGVVTRFWSTHDPPEGPDSYASEREAIHAARNWLNAQIASLQSRARALDRRETEQQDDRATRVTAQWLPDTGLAEADAGPEAEAKDVDG